MVSLIILCFITAQATIAIYLFNTLKLKNNFDRTLNAILIVLFFNLGTKFFILTVLKNTMLYEYSATGFSLSYGPLVYIAVRIFAEKPLGLKNVFIHMAPFLLCTLVYFVNVTGYQFHFVSFAFIEKYDIFYKWCASASMLLYPYCSFLLLKKENPATDSFRQYSKNLLTNICVIMLVVLVSSRVVTAISYLKTSFHSFDVRLIPYIFLSSLPLVILRYKMRGLAFSERKSPVAVPVQLLPLTGRPNQQEIVDNIQPEKRYKKSAMDEEMMDRYEETLIAFMSKTKLYLEPEVSLEDLSVKTHIPKHHLTQLLNERLDKNFYAFINEYRVAEAIEKLKKAEDSENILSLAFDCGFNSKSSFNNYFKKVTGLTPSAYRKEYQRLSLSDPMLVS